MQNYVAFPLPQNISSLMYWYTHANNSSDMGVLPMVNPHRSASICMRSLFLVIPPSTHSVDKHMSQSYSSASNNCTEKHGHSTEANQLHGNMHS